MRTHDHSQDHPFPHYGHRSDNKEYSFPQNENVTFPLTRTASPILFPGPPFPIPLAFSQDPLLGSVVSFWEQERIWAWDILETAAFPHGRAGLPHIGGSPFLCSPQQFQYKCTQSLFMFKALKMLLFRLLVCKSSFGAHAIVETAVLLDTTDKLEGCFCSCDPMEDPQNW